MIKIIDDWYITVDSYPTNYTVRRGEGKKGKNGKWLDKPKGHFNSLDGAVKEIRRLIIAERFENSVGTLETALDTITKVNARFEEILEKVSAGTPALTASTTASAWSVGASARNTRHSK